MRRRGFLTGAAAITAMSGLVDQPRPRASQGNGFWMPDEGARHARTFMQWPVSLEVHETRSVLPETQQVIAGIANVVANVVAAFEPVTMLMARAHQPAARSQLSSKVEIWDIPTDDLWARDSGLIFVRDAAGALGVVDVNFNGWGDRFHNPRDRAVAARVAARMGLPLFESGVVGEGGGVDADGDGALLAHESSWVNPNRSRLSRDEIEARLLNAYGAERMIWAPSVKGLDITDAHIDTSPGLSNPAWR